MEVAEALAKDIGARAACDGLAISRASYTGGKISQVIRKGNTPLRLFPCL